MKNALLKTAIVAGALLTAAAVPASAQGFGFGFSTGGYGRDHVGVYYNDYGRGYGDRYQYGSYNQPYYGGYGYGWRGRDWNDDRRWRRHHSRRWD